MYTREDEDQARQLWKKRLGLALLPAIVGLAAGITLFVVGRMRPAAIRCGWLRPRSRCWAAGRFCSCSACGPSPRWITCIMSNACCMDASAKPLGVLTRFSPELCERDGLWCHAMMVNLGSGEEEDDRLFYYDDEKPAPAAAHRHPCEGGEQRQDGERDLAGVRRARGACPRVP